jgi:hypothetical protein
MQFQLSTLFLIIFNVAATLALFASGGQWVNAIWINAIILYIASGLNRIRSFSGGLWYFFFFIIVADLYGVHISTYISNRIAQGNAACSSNLGKIGSALLLYDGTNNHFPPENICNKNGKALFSWRVELLPSMDCVSLYDSLNKDEPWNSPHNANLLSRIVTQYKCPEVGSGNADYTTNYIAIIGPGTAWRENGPVKLSDLPDGGSHTVMALETVNSGIHWAEPGDLTVDEAIERLKTGKGLRISTAHQKIIRVLFADGSVQSLPAKMPISFWKRILAGDVTDFYKLERSINPAAPDMVNVSTYSEPADRPIILGTIVWLLSIVLLFHRAIKSRKKPAAVEVVV